MANRLVHATSPYLLQHSGNPVNWWEWGEEAFAEAKCRDVPILLSVGYAACHWCHVMAHESFDDSVTARQMNRDFVCIKVDREERPDIDAIYMNATVTTTGQGGWPMTCFLTPAGEPFFCGTYWPKETRSSGGYQSMPSFTAVLRAISQAWTHRRADVDRTAAAITTQLRELTSALPSVVASHPTVQGEVTGIDAEILDSVIKDVVGQEDRKFGGFGKAPKFPPSAMLEGLLRSYEHRLDTAALAVAERTMTAMARGGIYDQLGGGFSRYSVDAAWVVPHFEKMLYDNALLLRAYAHWYRITGNVIARNVVVDTARFMLRDLGVGPAFASSLDADTEGVEGHTYVWTRHQLDEVLGDESAWAAEVFSVTEGGTFERGASTLQYLNDVDAQRLRSVRERLFAARQRRPQPARDDKVVTVWNGFAITALVEASVAVDDQTFVEAAQRCADYIIGTHVVDGALRRSSLGGVVGSVPGMLEDYGALITALTSLDAVLGSGRYSAVAAELADRAITTFAADEQGSWFDAPADTSLITRPRDSADGATPSGASLMAEALMTLDNGAAGANYLQLACETVSRASALLSGAPQAAGHWLSVATPLIAGPMRIEVTRGDGHRRLVKTARRYAPGGVVVVSGPETDPKDVGPDDAVREAAEPARVIVCRGATCAAPLTDPAEVANALRGTWLGQ